MNNLKPYIYRVKRLVLSNKVGQWCRLPYPGHPRGCPNYNQSEKCPPKAPRAQDIFNLDQSLYLVHSEFDLLAHASRMQNRHPHWSDRQCRCVLYWQGTSRRQLKDRCWQASWTDEKLIYTLIPEAMGVNIYATAALSGLKLERIKNITTVRHVALLGNKL